jgi:DNA-binding response OmpR family regulator
MNSATSQSQSTRATSGTHRTRRRIQQVDLRTGARLSWNRKTQRVMSEGVPIVVPPRCRPLLAMLFRDPGALVLRDELLVLCQHYDDPAGTLVDWIGELRARLPRAAIQTEGSRGYRLNVADPAPFQPEVLRAGDVVYYPQRHTIGRKGIAGECSLDAVEETLLALLVRGAGRLVLWSGVTTAANVSYKRARHAAVTLRAKLGGAAPELVVAPEGCHLVRGAAKVLRVNMLELAPADSEARVEGRPISLEPDELVFLATLGEQPGTVVSRSTLIGQLGCPEGDELRAQADWRDVVQRFEKQLDAIVTSLYRKFGDVFELIIQEGDGYVLATGDQLAVEGLLVDPKARWAACFDQEVPLTRKEVALLAKLMTTYPNGAPHDDLRSLGYFKAHFSHLRKKLLQLFGLEPEGARPAPEVITWVSFLPGPRSWTDGYQLVGEHLKRKRN